MVNPFILLPFYAYPSGSLWDALYTEVSGSPSLTFSIIVNVDTGPGTASPPSSDWITALSTLNSYNNTQLIGYVHTSWAERAIADVEADIDVYADWASYTGADIHMDGIFFDEAPHDDATEYVNYMVSATDYARSKLDSAYVVLNPGTTVSDSYYDTADMVVAAEDTYSAYSSASIEAVSESQRENSAFIIYSFVDSTSTQAETMNTLVNSGIPGIYITDEDGYESLSSIFSELVSGMASMVNSTDSSTSSSSTTSAAQSTATSSSTGSSTAATYSTTSSTGIASATAAAQSTTFSTSTATAGTGTTFSEGTSPTTATTSSEGTSPTTATTSSEGASLTSASTTSSLITAVSVGSSSVTSSETSSSTWSPGHPHGWGQHSSSGDKTSQVEDAGECDSD